MLSTKVNVPIHHIVFLHARVIYVIAHGAGYAEDANKVLRREIGVDGWRFLAPELQRTFYVVFSSPN